MLNRAYVGRQFSEVAPVTITGAAVSAFATALGDVGDSLIAPPTFLVSLTMPGIEKLKDDPDFGLDYSKVLHREQTFDFVRPVRVGDTVHGPLHIESIKAVAGSEVLKMVGKLSDGHDQLVATVSTTLFVAGDAS